jgi:hypothetical protein
VAFEIEYEVEKIADKSRVTSEKIVEKDVLPIIETLPLKNNAKEVTPEIVAEVFKGKYGKGSTDGTERFTKLTKAGYDAVEVQNKVNWVFKIASGLFDGDIKIIDQYGNGKQRLDKLGDWYGVVQKEINVLAGIDKW